MGRQLHWALILRSSRWQNIKKIMVITEHQTEIMYTELML